MNEDDFLISVRCGKSKAEEFQRLCKQQNVTRSEALRRYIEYCVKKNTLVFEHEVKITKRK